MPGRTTAAKRYAEAVAGIARQANSWQRWQQDLVVVRDALSSNAELRLMLESPRGSAERKNELLDRVLGAHVAPETMGLLHVMSKRGRLGLLQDVVVWFDEMADKAQGVVRLTVTSAAPLSDDERGRLRERLGAGAGQVILTERVDPSLMGGMVLRHEDVIRDYSVRSRLQSLRDRLN